MLRASPCQNQNSMLMGDGRGAGVFFWASFATTGLVTVTYCKVSKPYSQKVYNVQSSIIVITAHMYCGSTFALFLLMPFKKYGFRSHLNHFEDFSPI